MSETVCFHLRDMSHLIFVSHVSTWLQILELDIFWPRPLPAHFQTKQPWASPPPWAASEVDGVLSGQRFARLKLDMDRDLLFFIILNIVITTVIVSEGHKSD